MDAGLLSFSTTLRSFLDKKEKKGLQESSNDDSAHYQPESAPSEALADPSTPSNSWQASIYPSSASAIDSTDDIVAVSPRVSFDDFLEGGHDVNDLEWDLAAAQSLTFMDLRDWRNGLQHDASPEDVNALVVERRTELWRMVLAQKYLDPFDTPFVAPITPETRSEPYRLEPSNHETHWRIPFQRIHVSPLAIPSDLAALRLHSAGSLLAELNDIFGTRVEMESSLEVWLRSRVDAEMDLGLVYAYLRPWWHGWLASRGSFASVLTQMTRRREEDSRLRSEAAEAESSRRVAGAFPRVINTQVPPRRVWDLLSNRVVPYCALPSSAIPDNLWAVSHCWVAETDRQDVWTPINGYQWPVPLPIRTSLERVRIELLNLGAEYVFLDVLCLRQYSDEESERVRGYEWRLDVATLGYVYRHERYQTVVVYFNGLGRPFDVRHSALDSPLHWFRRAWTLQETTVNWLPGGLRASIPGQTGGLHFMSRMHESQRALGIYDRTAPSFSGLLHAMQNRHGHADKPYDCAAALMYLLPSSWPAVYSKRWSTAEDAWTALIESLPSRDRLSLLLWENPETTHITLGTTHASRNCWRPSWNKIMAHPRLIPAPHDLPYTEEEQIEGPVTSQGRRFYYHVAHVIEGCRPVEPKLISIPCDDDDEETVCSGSIERSHPLQVLKQFHFQSNADLSDVTSFTLIGVGDLERWVVGVEEDPVDIVGKGTASRFSKLTTGRMLDRVELSCIQDMRLGRRQLVAYLDTELQG